MGQKNRPLRGGRGLRSEAQQVHAPGGADKAQEIKRYVGPFYVEVGFVCLDALAGRTHHPFEQARTPVHGPLCGASLPTSCFLGFLPLVAVCG